MVISKQQEEDIKNVAKKVFQDTLIDKQFMSSFADKLADMVFTRLADKIDCLNNKIVELNASVEKVNKVNSQLISRVEELEQKMKLPNLRLHGVKEKRGENIKDVIKTIFEEKNICKPGEVEIVGCYRIGNAKIGSKKPRPIMLKFLTHHHRNIVFFSKKNLKGSKLTISEDLTTARYKLLLKTKEHFGKENIWSQDGNIHIKVDGQKHIIKTEMELEELIGRND